MTFGGTPFLLLAAHPIYIRRLIVVKALYTAYEIRTQKSQKQKVSQESHKLAPV